MIDHLEELSQKGESRLVDNQALWNDDGHEMANSHRVVQYTKWLHTILVDDASNTQMYSHEILFQK